jgi:hypothetical protein
MKWLTLKFKLLEVYSGTYHNASVYLQVLIANRQKKSLACLGFTLSHSIGACQYCRIGIAACGRYEEFVTWARGQFPHCLLMAGVNYRAH